MLTFSKLPQFDGWRPRGEDEPFQIGDAWVYMNSWTGNPDNHPAKAEFKVMPSKAGRTYKQNVESGDLNPDYWAYCKADGTRARRLHVNPYLLKPLPLP